MVRTLLPFFFALACGLAQALELVITIPVETRGLKVAGVSDTFKTWQEMLGQAQGARSTLDIEQFYISHKPGEPMEPILGQIRNAAASGTRVRLIVDKTFLKNEPSSATILADTENIEVRILDYAKIAGGVQHSKYFIVNGSDAYLGSANFDWRALKHIHETGIRTQDPHLVSSLAAVFEKDWARAVPTGTFRFKNTPKSRSTIARAGNDLLAVSPISDGIKSAPSTIEGMLKLIASAKNTVQLQTMDYTTKLYGSQASYTDLQKALIEAAKTKTVQLLVDKTKSKQDGLAELARNGVEVRTVEFPEHSGGPIPYARLIHSKYLIVDGESFWIGTDNMTGSYYHGSRGVGVLSSDAAVAPLLEKTFLNLWKSSYSKPL